MRISDGSSNVGSSYLDVLEGVYTGLVQQAAQARGFKLEHAVRLAPAHHLERLLFVEGDEREVDVDAAAGQQRAGALQHRQRLEAEEVELHQAGLLDELHEIGRAHV